VLLSKIGINRSLWVLAVQALSNLTYFIQAQLGKDYRFMVLTINVENFVLGWEQLPLLPFNESCNQRFSATQYAFSEPMAVSRDILVAPAGTLVEITSWPLFFLISIAAALPDYCCYQPLPLEPDVCHAQTRTDDDKEDLEQL